MLEDGLIEEIPAKHLTTKILSVYDTENSTIGWNNFLKGESYNSWALSKCFSIVYQLERSIFRKVMKNLKKDLYFLSERKEKITEEGRKFQRKCLGCGELTHNAINCPRLHYIPTKIEDMIK